MFAKIGIPCAEIAQLVEHNLAKVGVASSSLVFRSSFRHSFFHSIRVSEAVRFLIHFFVPIPMPLPDRTKEKNKLSLSSPLSSSP